jgi:hypothetical protein
MIVGMDQDRTGARRGGSIGLEKAGNRRVFAGVEGGVRFGRVRACLAVVLGGLLAACGGGSGNTGGSASCVFLARFQGHEYTSVAVAIGPVEGRPLGTAVLPGCGDTGRSTPRDEEVPVGELPGVSPQIAIVLRGTSNQVLVRKGVDRLPPEVRRLLHAPACDAGDQPIELSGPWLGIHDQDRTEVDLIPPYQLDMLVMETTNHRYERAYLMIQVPESLGHPLSREDLAGSLWRGGTISITSGCQDGRFVAQRVNAFPPD